MFIQKIRDQLITMNIIMGVFFFIAGMAELGNIKNIIIF